MRDSQGRVFSAAALVGYHWHQELRLIFEPAIPPQLLGGTATSASSGLNQRQLTKRKIWSAVRAMIPNIRLVITFAGPRTRTIRPPNSSFSRA